MTSTSTATAEDVIRAVDLLQDSTLVATLLGLEPDENGIRAWEDVRVAAYLTIEVEGHIEVVAAVRYKSHLLPVWAVPGYEFHAISDLGRSDTAYVAAYGAQPEAPAEFLREELVAQRAMNREAHLEHLRQIEDREGTS